MMVYYEVGAYASLLRLRRVVGILEAMVKISPDLGYDGVVWLRLL